MGGTIHIVPVGHTPQTIIESLRRYPVSKIVFVFGDDPEQESEQTAHQTAESVKKAFGSVDISEIEVSTTDVLSAALKIAKTINKLRAEGEVMVNLSGSLRTIGLSAYMAASVTNTKAYVGTPKYEGKKVTGVKEVVELPQMPLKKLFDEKRYILNEISSEGTILEEIITKLSPKLIKGDPRYNSERSRISHHLKDLKKDSLIETKKEGKNTKAYLTKLGELYKQGF